MSNQTGTTPCPKCRAPDSRECRCAPDEQWEAQCPYGQKDCTGGAAYTCALPAHEIITAETAGNCGPNTPWDRLCGEPSCDYCGLRWPPSRLDEVIDARLSQAPCWCHKCNPQEGFAMHMIVCPECGNKRCPMASDHALACTNSNEPGQAGSVYL